MEGFLLLYQPVEAGFWCIPWFLVSFLGVARLIPRGSFPRGPRVSPPGLCPRGSLAVPDLNPPLQNLIFRYLQNRSRIQVWLYEQVNMRIEGCIIGFDEYMNLVLDDAEEIHSKTKSRKQLGRIMLKGDNITLLQSVSN
ncbi:small nuclear ribonucleoprotein E [Manacus vitellinus]|uniref:small nuclear ribonucleoprotein E n=1 Tax=Manacus vitellinus TaxID=328815 RepID=UPI00115D245E|nr:small nuclear ribonucleoprotein E [Manacus vitellinus]